LFLALLGRLWQVQILNGDQYARRAAEDHVRQIALPPVRGQIVDDRGRPLVRNKAAMTVSVDRVALSRMPDGGRAVLDRLGHLLGVPRATIERKIRLCGPAVSQPCWPGSPYQSIPVAERVDKRVALQILERAEDFPGVTAEPQPVREYPGGSLAAHALGYLAPDDPAGPVGPSGTILVGRDGLEATYDAALRGTPGSRQVVVDSAGRVLRTRSEQPARPGDTLVSSIDAEVQKVTERALKRAVLGARKRGLPADSGAAVVLDVRTGYVLALAAYPTYDPSVWTGGISAADYRRLRGGHDPLLSRAIQGQWPPGSTWKVTSTAAAAKAGYDPMATYSCPGSYLVGNRPFRNYEGTPLGVMNLPRALTLSCDTIFYRFADEMWRKDGGTKPVKHPKDPMQHMARAFGFGAKTGIDLPGEAAGRVPDRAWKRAYWKDTKKATCKAAHKGYPKLAKTHPGRAAYLKAIAAENCHDGYVWRVGDAANFAVGQGDVLVTPLQLARAYAAIANGGKLYSPRAGKALVHPDGTLARRIKPRVTGHLPVSRKVLKEIRSGLAQVPRVGTAAGAFAGFPFAELPVAGKTGTAEAYGKEDTSWFASYGPVGKPRYAIVAMVSQGGTGAGTAAPAVREIWSGIYGLEGAPAALPDGTPPKKLPDLTRAAP
jgi:penicillin-binding protein 2